MGDFNFGPVMPPWVLYPATLIVLAILVYPFYRVRSGIARFALFAMSFRYLAAAHHNITFRSSPIGMSWNALGSSAIFLTGLLLIKRRHLMLKPLIPCYLVVAVVGLSGFANHDIPGIVDVVVKFGYFVVIVISVYEGLNELGDKRMMNLLLWSALIPLFFQFLSIVFHVAKTSEGDGSVSYIGGYNHEAGFSIGLATCFVIGCFANGLNVWVRSGILLALLLGMLEANYRTTILAFAPLALVQFNLDIIGRFPARQRVVVAVGILTISSLIALAGIWMLRERFADLATTFGNLGELMKRQEQFTPDERYLLSTRPYIWSGYVYAYLDGSLRNHLLGYGPESWIGVFQVYAHNTVISQLYEYGVAGVVAIILLWSTMLFCAVRAQGPRGKLLAAHGSFFILNMATMPHWLIEGNILYGIICGYTLYRYFGPAMVPVLKPAAVKRPGPRLLSADPEPVPNLPRAPIATRPARARHPFRTARESSR